MIGSPDRSKRLAWMVLLLALMSGAFQMPWAVTPTAVAQDAAEEEPAAEDAAPKKKAAKADAKAAPEHEKDGFVMWVIKTGGSIGIFLFLLMGYFIATSIKLFLELQPQIAMPPELIEDIKQKMEKKDYKGGLSERQRKGLPLHQIRLGGAGRIVLGIGGSS